MRAALIGWLLTRWDGGGPAAEVQRLMGRAAGLPGRARVERARLRGTAEAPCRMRIWTACAG